MPINPTNPEHAAIVDKLADALSALSIGGLMTYAAASALASRDVSGPYRYLLDAAREKAEKNSGCLFECVRTVGVKRLSASESPEVGLASIRRVRKAAKRGARRLDRLNANSLSEPENRRVISYKAMLGAVAMIADGNKARTVAAAVDPAKPIPPQNILEMFR
jgi:hypothetical protein